MANGNVVTLLTVRCTVCWTNHIAIPDTFSTKNRHRKIFDAGKPKRYRAKCRLQRDTRSSVRSHVSYVAKFFLRQRLAKDSSWRVYNVTFVRKQQKRPADVHANGTFNQPNPWCRSCLYHRVLARRRRRTRFRRNAANVSNKISHVWRAYNMWHVTGTFDFLRRSRPNSYRSTRRVDIQNCYEYAASYDNNNNNIACSASLLERMRVYFSTSSGGSWQVSRRWPNSLFRVKNTSRTFHLPSAIKKFSWKGEVYFRFRAHVFFFF